MIQTINDFDRVFFIGIAGTGMSAIAQYLKGIGKDVAGSDRYFKPHELNDTRQKLEAAGILCFEQDGSGILPTTDLVVVSTAVEDTVPEVSKARSLDIPIIRRSELLALIAKSKKTIAVGGTSGKSTTSAMLFDILQYAGLEPSIISGAGLVSIIREGKIGNAKVGNGEWLVIEADESDGSIVQYHPAIGLLLNIDKDHKEVEALMDIFSTFKKNSELFVVNQSHALAATLSEDLSLDFSWEETRPAGYMARDFKQEGLSISFTINNSPFNLQLVGRHNMENALGAAAVAAQVGVDLSKAAEALAQYEGIYRRNQVLGQKNGVWMMDDYAHNPAKCAASIRACQPIAPKVIAWFQPHGYGPTRFLRADFVAEISAALRPQDEIWMSEIFYAGGTATKDISANDLVEDIRQNGKSAFFVENRAEFLEQVRPHLTENTVLLLMGARDPSLEHFAREVWEKL
ncbi:Mur ligase domain-containing protein [Flavihumibacter sp. CACIAM 22H1]|uniref:UDP-N-acetylmuramate--L-alanine ligase n=1 Tax=Flavihumibacter sp. CACIAM 22H1 TaxID=1812911 RepID=UPI0007A80FC0|nr:Mur ligase domain-containing protein [Flavihumibacter sp. CACIAM 22H1]KYP12967.1 MAG: UDP-N-acetylmuramate--alanine ligase [Flavihumibacter sp. CACIAM 22H1]